MDYGTTQVYRRVPITPEQIAALPPEFRAILQAVINRYDSADPGTVSRIGEAFQNAVKLVATMASLPVLSIIFAMAKTHP